MAGKNLSYREFSKLLRENGWTLARYKGDHAIWKKEGCLDISIPTVNPNPIYLQRFCKQYNLGGKNGR